MFYDIFYINSCSNCSNSRYHMYGGILPPPVCMKWQVDIIYIPCKEQKLPTTFARTSYIFIQVTKESLSNGYRATYIVCLGVFVPLENFSLIWRYHHYRWLQLLTYVWNLWPLSREGSLTCHTYFDTGQRFKMVISEDLLHSHLLSSVLQWSCHYLF